MSLSAGFLKCLQHSARHYEAIYYHDRPGRQAELGCLVISCLVCSTI